MPEANKAFNNFELAIALKENSLKKLITIEYSGGKGEKGWLKSLRIDFNTHAFPASMLSDISK